jgi:hypothetical protein
MLVFHSCNPSYEGAEIRRITIQASPGEKGRDPVSKNILQEVTGSGATYH